MKKVLSSTLENSKNYSLQVATAMSEEGYEFRPVETVWNFRELIHHIAYGIFWWQENFIAGNKTDWDPPVAKKNKSEAVKYLSSAFESLEVRIAKSSLSPDEVQGFHATLDHITHHRGQAVTYLRCKGLVPPEYVY